MIRLFGFFLIALCCLGFTAPLSAADFNIDKAQTTNCDAETDAVGLPLILPLGAIATIEYRANYILKRTSDNLTASGGKLCGFASALKCGVRKKARVHRRNLGKLLVRCHGRTCPA